MATGQPVRARTAGPADLVELVKPRISAMVVVTAGMGFLLSGADRGLGLLLHTLIGTWLLAAAGSVYNQILEGRVDALMHRTRNRPLAAGRLTTGSALAFGTGLALAGLLDLALNVNPLTALLGAAALVGYVLVYTPLKRVSWLATLVGAVPGALPPVMGWSAATGQLAGEAWVLFGILFLWQLPHFLAIAWLCREDYARAGFPQLSVLDPSGRRSGRQMVFFGLLLLPVSLLPTATGLCGLPYLLGSALLGLLYLATGLWFLVAPETRSARASLSASVAYLPALLAAMLLDRAL